MITLVELGHFIGQNPLSVIVLTDVGQDVGASLLFQIYPEDSLLETQCGPKQK